METLIVNGGNIHLFHGFRNETKYTPLMLAVKNGHLETVKFLHEIGANIILPGPNEQTPLHYAAIYGHLDIVKFLIENGADANPAFFFSPLTGPGFACGTPLFMASTNGHIDIVKYLHQNGADLDVTG